MPESIDDHVEDNPVGSGAVNKKTSWDKLSFDINQALLYGVGLLFLYGGACGAMEAGKSIANYSAQATAITNAVYSVADKITPEVVEQARQMVSQLADKPNSLAALSCVAGISCGFFLIYHSLKPYARPKTDLNPKKEDNPA